VGLGGRVGRGDGVGKAVGEGCGVGLGTRLADGGKVSGTSVGGGPGEAAPARGFGVGVPPSVMLTFKPFERFTRKIRTARPTTSTPNSTAIQGQRLDGSSRSGAPLRIVLRESAVSVPVRDYG
jgi:hypothetical protein